ncbi:MAG: UDP-N-acetylmuramoyl-L-alanine--D-glutamate ligase [Ideonella sp.]|nr:UDP-N-acetylmuramoyl-L-alanine--D-glutamate ligase [Ideonella sp.]
MNHLQNLSVLILGLGDSGLAMARWCVRHGAARVRVWDSRAQPPQLAALVADVPSAEFFSGALAEQQLEDARLVLKSPGLSPLDEKVRPLLEAAQAVDIRVAGELDLFARALADLKQQRRYAPKVLAITGTNGKTTTTALTAMLVERAGRRVTMAGNIGPTMLDTLAAALDLEPAPQESALEADEVSASAQLPSAPIEQLDPQDETLDETPALMVLDGANVQEVSAASEHNLSGEAVSSLEDDAPLVLAPPPEQAQVFEHLPQVWVLELSSFQLDGVQGFEPDAATVLNVTQDHLDWHGTMASYAEAKSRIFGQAALMVINRDDASVQAMVPPPVMVKGGRGRPTKAVTRPLMRFGLDAPQHGGDYGLITEGGMAWLVRAMPVDETIKRRKGEEEEILLQRLMPADALRVRGRHNAANALAALALATAIGCPLAPMLHGLREYRGEPHRVELLGQVGGVEAFDDSKGTNVGATVAALQGLGADKLTSKLVVILGGDGKGQDFGPLAAPVARYARAVATLGKDAESIEQALAQTSVPLQRHADLPSAVRWAFEQAQAGDAVLLSPACASLDMFRNYAHRAEVFVAAVKALAEERGEMMS